MNFPINKDNNINIYDHESNYVIYNDYIRKIIEIRNFMNKK